MATPEPSSVIAAGQASDQAVPIEPAHPRHYVTTLLECYAQLPHTPKRPTKNDRILAARLFDQNVPFDTVKAAFVLATSRRTFRPNDAPPLEPIRSLAYFLPVIEELLRTPPDMSYVLLLKQRLHTGFPDLGVPPLDPPIPW